MEFDKALEYAVILGWDDMTGIIKPASARVEYRGAPGTSVDYLRVWSVDAEGHQKMVCSYWTWTSPAHQSGICFTSDFSSRAMGLALDFVLMNQGQFTRPSDACAEGLALVNPPSGDQRAEASAWMGGVHGVATTVSRSAVEKAAAL